MTEDQLTSELLDALLGNQISESLSSEVRKSIYQTRSLSSSGTTLEKTLIDALIAGKSMVISGSAGGGKTMLIEYMVSEVMKSNPEIKLCVIKDLTAIPGDRAKFLKDSGVPKKQFVIAANEGILRSSDVRQLLPRVWENLRSLQNGEKIDDENGIIVVDIAGFDPVSTSLVGILTNPDIRRAVLKAESECVHNNGLGCPRIEALDLLDTKMASLVSTVIKSAYGSGEVTYRELWNFAIDILLGGNCDGPVPSSAWFWRIFKGENSISNRLILHHSPQILPMPDITPHLYRGDWQKLSSIAYSDEYRFVDPGTTPIGLTSSTEISDLLLWLKVQTAFVLRAQGSNKPVFLGERTGDLERQVLRENRLDLLIQAINSYFWREPRISEKSSLSLWIDFATQKRSKRSKSLVGLGNFPRRDLEIRRSYVIANLLDGEEEGTRAYLKTKRTNKASLELTTQLFSALIQGRPISTERRKYDDADYALRRFFLQAFDKDLVEDQDVIYLLTTHSADSVSESAFRVVGRNHVEKVKR
jgi:hypothetical protein